MSLIVRKYGGSSVATPEQIKDIAKRISEIRKSGHEVIVVVSAMGSTTDQLSNLAYQVSSAPVRRELDMLLSTGERVASSLMSLALNDIGCPAISFTGSQAGILTDDSHTNARVLDIKPVRVEHELSRGKVVVLAGFQGVSPFTKEVTTLGRGGTDLSAVAMAHHFKSQRCEILKDVDGVFTGDPRIVDSAKRIPEMSFEALQEITFWGAKMLHHRAAELAARVKLPVFIGLAHADGKGTLIHGETKMFEDMKVLSVNSHAKVYKLQVKAGSHGQAYEKLDTFLSQNVLPWPQILDSTFGNGTCTILVAAPIETLEAITNLGKKNDTVSVANKDLASVSATCAGAIASSLIGQLTQAVEKQNITAHHILLSPMSATFVVDSPNREKTIKTLHEFV